MIVKDKVFVVTGAGDGIGRDVALTLVHKGARVAAVDISESGLRETAARVGGCERLSTHTIDVVDRSAVSALPDVVAQTHGAVDGVVSVAGIIHKFARFDDLAFSDIERVINVNFYGVLNVTKAFLPVLLKRPEANITAVSSMGSFVSVPGQTVYGASKAAVKALMEGLDSELRDTDVRVSVVFPGAIATNIAVNSGALTPEASAARAQSMRMTPSAVAATKIVRGIEKGSRHIRVGWDSIMLDKLSRLAPAQTARLVHSRMRDLLSNS
ncbi:short-chain dehydrogenase [Mycobacterium heckeshornense]|uniref:Oxidoreductase n=1 Tax=Mycobacterium heckeshornense TaxID=110505 RepID=A0A2G8B4M6_9MYCO|nr:SDR family NAD(P)-dependent oxidoreductase [Mycobacterium heckeshornense]KMV24242.1 short-chain dehydrogenase [Mycobacterium heckeshornense]MCV7036481.1 SDR family NAD(P)-dependent oxidoreductase [Mycobacterium heckeshornense]PIJ32698.1 short-chain dehydrogenase [Mycobacterium heckeshornense]BCO34344.1 oxidoreductase [Mycobacterium heckeshornense]BCQ07481.1 short-chain type dehydrogenase/reductase [Mycobacterium heckeshornense]